MSVPSVSEVSGSPREKSWVSPRPNVDAAVRRAPTSRTPATAAPGRSARSAGSGWPGRRSGSPRAAGPERAARAGRPRRPARPPPAPARRCPDAPAPAGLRARPEAPAARAAGRTWPRRRAPARSPRPTSPITSPGVLYGPTFHGSPTIRASSAAVAPSMALCQFLVEVPATGWRSGGSRRRPGPSPSRFTSFRSSRPSGPRRDGDRTAPGCSPDRGPHGSWRRDCTSMTIRSLRSASTSGAVESRRGRPPPASRARRAVSPRDAVGLGRRTLRTHDRRRLAEVRHRVERARLA